MLTVNSKLETEARNGIEKDVCKLMDNSVHGNSVENFRKHTEILDL